VSIQVITADINSYRCEYINKATMHNNNKNNENNREQLQAQQPVLKQQ